MFRISTCACVYWVRKEEISVMLLNGLSAWPLFLTFCHFRQYTSEGNMCLGEKRWKTNEFLFLSQSVLFYLLCNVARDTFIL